jgi:oligopeptide transport system substrate-binding protein
MQRFDEQVAIRAISPEVLEVRLVRPTPYFLELLAFPAFFPMHQPSLDSCSRLDPASGALRVSSEWTRPPGLICNGPFFVQEWVFKRSMRLVLNPHYWNRQGVHVRSIEFPIVEDAGAQALAFRTGAADVVFDVTAPFRAEMVRLKREFRGRHAAAAQPLQAQGVDEIAIDRALPSDPATSTQVFPAFGTYFYNFNCGPVLADGRPNPLSDARVRRALAMSVDKQGIVERIRRCGERAAAGIIPPGSIQGYSSPKGLSFDPEAARSLLADAGYPQGRGLPVLEILFNKDGGHDLIAQAVAKDWQQLLKVECRLVMKESKTFRQDLKQGRFMISRASWTGDYADPTTFLDINRSTDNNNDRRYASRKYDDMLDRASTLHASPAERMRALAEAERFLVEEEVPFLPLFHHVEINLFDARRVSGITSNPRQVQELINLDVIGDGIGTDEYLPPEP